MALQGHQWRCRNGFEREWTKQRRCDTSVADSSCHKSWCAVADIRSCHSCWWCRPWRIDFDLVLQRIRRAPSPSDHNLYSRGVTVYCASEHERASSSHETMASPSLHFLSPPHQQGVYMAYLTDGALNSVVHALSRLREASD
uniref:Uncharacterized protein n=1 Tax=Arundo donax TaxID=35708 RepID=A0A0A9CLA8_ARUDO